MPEADTELKSMTDTLGGPMSDSFTSGEFVTDRGKCVNLIRKILRRKSEKNNIDSATSLEYSFTVFVAILGRNHFPMFDFLIPQRITSAVFIAFTAFTVRRSGSPGPQPTAVSLDIRMILEFPY